MTANVVCTRRRLLRDAAALGALAVAAPLVAACAPAGAPLARATEPPKATPLPPPETTTIRFTGIPTCDCAVWVWEEMLKEEGFAELKTGITSTVAPGQALVTGEVDFSSYYGNYLVSSVDAGLPVVTVAGEHSGCIEMWAAPGITSVRDLRGKTYEAFDRESVFGGKKAVGLFYGLMASILSHIGMDMSDLNVVDVPEDRNTIADYRSGKGDVVLLPVHNGPLMRRDPNKRGSKILDTTLDKPWSQNYCCMLTVNRDWARSNPAATKRATRAFLRALDIVQKDKKTAVDAAVRKGYYRSNAALTPEILMETIEMLSYDWRELDPEDTLRFFTLRLRDAKKIKKSPQQILDEGTDFAYFKQLRKELRP